MATIHVTDEGSRIQYTATGGQVNFTFPFLIFNEVDLAVYQTPAGQDFNPATDLLILNNDYTVTINGAPLEGGTVTLVAAAAAGDLIVIDRAVPFTNDTDFTTAGPFLAAEVDLEFDRQTVLAQQARDLILERGLYYLEGQPLSTTGGDNILPVLDANTGVGIPIWSKDGAGNLIATLIEENANCSTLRTDLLSQTMGSPGTDNVGYYNPTSGGVVLTTDLDNLHAQVDQLEIDVETTITNLPSGILEGLEVENDTSDPASDILFTPGRAHSASGTAVIDLTSNLVKQLDAAWAQGTNSGGNFVSPVAASNTTYYLFVIKKDSDGSVDAGFDTDPAAANRPAGWTEYARVAVLYTDGSAQWVLFLQSGDYFWLNTYATSYSMLNPGNSAITVTTNLPSNIALDAIVLGAIQVTNPAGSNHVLYMSSLALADLDPTVATSNFDIIVPPATGDFYYSAEKLVPVTDRDIRIRGGNLGASATVLVTTRGWVDRREKP